MQQWNQQIDAEQWDEFVASILKNHYDLAYRRAGDEKSNYPAPAETITLCDFSTTSLDQATSKLMTP